MNPDASPANRIIRRAVVQSRMGNSTESLASNGLDPKVVSNPSLTPSPSVSGSSGSKSVPVGLVEGL